MKPAPQNLDAERSILGGIILDPEAISDVAAVLEPKHFFASKHGTVFSAMLAIGDKNEPIDRVSVKAELTRNGMFEAVGADDFIDLLDKITPSAANLLHYARIVLEAAMLRELTELCTSTARQAYEQETGGPELVDRLAGQLMEMRLGTKSREPVKAREAVRDAFKGIESRYGGGEIFGLRTGLARLDHLTLGWRPGELVVLAARPSVGKSAMAGCWAIQAGIRERRTVAWFSLEMSKDELMLRLLAAIGRVSLNRLQSGACIESDWSKLANAAGQIAESEIHVDDTPAITAMEIRAKTRRIAMRAPADRPLSLVIVDYLGLMGTRTNAENRNVAVEECSRAMKQLAGELKCTVVLLSQLNRAVEKRAEKRPMLSDLRDSGAVEQDADAVVFLAGETGTSERKIYLDKRRNGATGIVDAEYRGEFTLFLDASHEGEVRREHYSAGSDAA